MTAVEWLVETLIRYNLVPKETNSDNVLFNKAKEMEKQQILKSFDEGQEYEYQYHINSAPKFDSLTYYKETFKKA